jgi:hypothetical protein
MVESDATRADLFDGLPPAFRLCAGTLPYRYRVDEPFVEGDHLYATDGIWAVRARLADLPPGIDLVRFPVGLRRAVGRNKGSASKVVAAELFAPQRWEESPYVVPADLPARVPCPTCGECSMPNDEPYTVRRGVGFRAGRLAALRDLGAEIYLPKPYSDRLRFVVGVCEGVMGRTSS